MSEGVSTESDPFESLDRRLRKAQDALETCLAQRSLGRARDDTRQLAIAVRRTAELVEVRLEDVAEFEVARVETIARHISELAASRPDVLAVLARKLLSTDLGEYFGGRYETAVAAALTRRDLPYLYELKNAPDFAVRVNGTNVGIECTSARLETLEDPDPFHKVEYAIRNKARKVYASRRVAVTVDVTILQARSRRAGGNLLGDDLETRLNHLLLEGPFGALIATVQLFDDRVRPRKVAGPYRRVDHGEIEPALAKLLDLAFPKVVTNERIPLAWISHWT